MLFGALAHHDMHVSRLQTRCKRAVREFGDEVVADEGSVCDCAELVDLELGACFDESFSWEGAESCKFLCRAKGSWDVECTEQLVELRLRFLQALGLHAWSVGQHERSLHYCLLVRNPQIVGELMEHGVRSG